MNDAPERPQPPEGFQRPGVPGAGNLLDPEVRGELREKVKEAAHGARDQVQAGQPGGEKPATSSPPPGGGDGQEVSGSGPQSSRVGPFPHGDVDLSGLAANVTPAKPSRSRGRRRFYFLKETMDAKDDETPQPAPGPKPG